MSEETETTHCVNCKRKAKTYRIVKSDIVWADNQGNESEKGTIKLTLFDAIGPVCRKCMLEAVEYVRQQVESGKSLVPRSGRTKRFKVL